MQVFQLNCKGTMTLEDARNNWLSSRKQLNGKLDIQFYSRWAMKLSKELFQGDRSKPNTQASVVRVEWYTTFCDFQKRAQCCRLHGIRVGHGVLLHSFAIFSSFYRLMRPKRKMLSFLKNLKECKECKRTQRTQHSFAKNVKECREHFVLLQRT